jgi:predicted outer membrane repeat protein
VTISGLTIKDGDVSGAGAGILCDRANGSANSLVLDNVVITGNTATNLGGGVYFDRCDVRGLGDLIVRNSTISGNSTDSNGCGSWMGAPTSVRSRCSRRPRS